MLGMNKRLWKDGESGDGKMINLTIITGIEGTPGSEVGV